MHSQYGIRITTSSLPIRRVLSLLFVLLVLGILVQEPDSLVSNTNEPSTGELRWWKGNLHTHTLWSDGSHYPENIVEHYKSSGYHFLALSDHNILSVDPNKWVNVARSSGGIEAYGQYLDRFGLPWVEKKSSDGALYARLKTLEEVRELFEEPDKFILIQAEEISSRAEQQSIGQINSGQLDSGHLHQSNHHHSSLFPIHVVAVNIINLISAQQGDSLVEVLQNSVNTVLAQSQQTDTPMLAIIAHPNFREALTAQDILQVDEAKFFEVYNGHVFAYSAGTSNRPSTDHMWDAVLTERLNRNGEIMYGVAADDTHTYLESESDCCNSKRGWVVVRAQQLNATSIVNAMNQGDFYSSTGVELVDIQTSNSQITIEVQEEANVSYTTQFIGTQVNSNSTGILLATVEGPQATYTFSCNELYVRAKVISSKAHPDPSQSGEVEVAWTQPVPVEDCPPNILLPLIHTNPAVSKSVTVTTSLAR